MLGFQLGHVLHLQQLHGAEHLFGEDFDGAVHAAAATCHQPVQVGAPNQGELRAQCQAARTDSRS